MQMLLIAVFVVVAGETYSDSVTIDAIGDVRLPPGEWLLEHAVDGKKQTDTTSTYVFKKVGDRLERLTFQFHPNGLPLRNYVDSIGDGFELGIPRRLLDKKTKSSHDNAYNRPGFIDHSERALFRMMIYCDEPGRVPFRPPWMGHGVVFNIKSGVLICLHTSPYALSPETIRQLFVALAS